MCYNETIVLPIRAAIPYEILHETRYNVARDSCSQINIVLGQSLANSVMLNIVLGQSLANSVMLNIVLGQSLANSVMLNIVLGQSLANSVMLNIVLGQSLANSVMLNIVLARDVVKYVFIQKYKLVFLFKYTDLVYLYLYLNDYSVMYLCFF